MHVDHDLLVAATGFVLALAALIRALPALIRAMRDTQLGGPVFKKTT
jgi:hypothetical protein